MQVTETLSEGLKRGFTVVVPNAAIESRRGERLAELARTLKLPGFRPGKVPPGVVRQRFGNAVTAEVVEQSINESVQQVLTDRGLRPALQPKVDLLNSESVGPTSDLEFKIEVEVLPEFSLPDFSAVELTRLKAEVTEEILDKALVNIATRNRELVETPPEERAEHGAGKGEFVVADYIGRVDGAEFPGGKATDATIEVGGDGFIPGFTDGFEGIHPGETRSIELTFPDPYPNQELAGKPVTFELTAKTVKRAKIPALDDEFAQSLSFEGIDELKSFVRTRTQREYDELSRARLKRELLDRLSGLVNFELPPTLVENEFNQIWGRLEADRKAGNLDEEDRAKDDEALRRDYRAIAERRVRLGLLLAEAGRAGNIAVTPDELNRAMRAEAGRFPGQEKQILDFFRANPRAAEALRGPIFEEKAVDMLIGRAKVTDQPSTIEELVREPDAPPSAIEAAPAEVADAASGTEAPEA